MKKRFAFIVSYLGVLCLLLLGVSILGFAPREERLSTGENRMLAAFPSPGGGAVHSGEFMDGFESWLSDAFPARDALVGISEDVMRLFGERDEDYVRQEAIAREERTEIPEENREEIPARLRKRLAQRFPLVSI